MRSRALARNASRRARVDLLGEVWATRHSSDPFDEPVDVGWRAERRHSIPIRDRLSRPACLGLPAVENLVRRLSP